MGKIRKKGAWGDYVLLEATQLEHKSGFQQHRANVLYRYSQCPTHPLPGREGICVLLLGEKNLMMNKYMELLMD